jgi:ABC-type taurine transport system ATPase subunit
MNPSIDIDDVTLTYKGASGDVLALRGTTLHVEKGEFAAVVGPSGCGKSSLMKLATGLVRPDNGGITIFGDKVQGPVKIAGMAFQSPHLLPWRKVIENILLPLEIVEPHRSQFRAKKEEYRERGRALLATVGLSGFEDRYPWELSGGMQQRASLCRALIHQPALAALHRHSGDTRFARGRVPRRPHPRHERATWSYRHDQGGHIPAAARSRHLLRPALHRRRARIARQDRGGPEILKNLA